MNNTQLKKKFDKEFHVEVVTVKKGDLSYDYNTLKADPKDIWSFILSALEEQRKEIEKEIGTLIVEELLIANKEGQPTSRLTSLAVKIKNLSHKKETKK
jgi:flagellar capping protein FliD